MKYRALLFDLDGVINQSAIKFSQKYSKEFGVDLEILNPFFETQKPLANKGKADLKELLQAVLAEWKWTGSVNELIDYWMNADCTIDERIVRLAKELKTTGFTICLVTDQERYRTKYIWNKLGLQHWIDYRFVSCELGVEKDDPAFYQNVISTLQAKPEELLLIDDSPSKIHTAQSCHLHTYLYRDFDSFAEFAQKNLLA